jgi:hypothetical protein
MRFSVALAAAILVVAGLRIFFRPSINIALARFRTQSRIGHLVNPLQLLVDLPAE